jgi:mRNA-degrading endonuclease RelE of RelBE toxin-antitoxin system
MKVILSKDASKQYKRLPKIEQTKIYKKLTVLQKNPYEGKKLAGELESVRSLRAWPYRILYEVNEEQKTVEIHKIAHRQGAYK